MKGNDQNEDKLEELDLTKIEKTASEEIITKPIKNRIKESVSLLTYDRKKHQDYARIAITIILLIFLGTVLIWGLVLMSTCTNNEEKVKNIFQLILSPLIALVSAATGFYFGSKAE